MRAFSYHYGDRVPFAYLEVRPETFFLFTEFFMEGLETLHRVLRFFKSEDGARGLFPARKRVPGYGTFFETRQAGSMEREAVSQGNGTSDIAFGTGSAPSLRK